MAQVQWYSIVRMGIIRLRVELRALRHAINELEDAIEKYSEAVRAAQKAGHEIEAEQKIVPVLVSYDQQINRGQSDQNATQEKIAKWTKRAVIAAAIYAAITAIYAAIAVFQWREMRRATKASEAQLALMRDADRPWIDIDISITSPLTYDGKSVRAEFTFVPTDVGQSPAQNISINPTLTPAFMGDDLNGIQKRLCDSAATKSGMASLQYVLFRGRHYSQPVTLEIPIKDIDSHWGKMPAGVGPSDAMPIALIGCVDYMYETSDRHHQTAFAVDILTKDGLLPLKSKTPLSPSELILRSHPTSGHYPN